MKNKIFVIILLMLLIAACLPVIEASDEQAVSKNENLEEESVQYTPNTVANANVFTDKFFYQQGEPVVITFYNVGSTTVALGCGEPMFNIHRFAFFGFQWVYIYPDWFHPILIWIFAGNSKTETWDQKDSDGNQVPWGFYKVEVPYYEDSPPVLCKNTLNQQIAYDYFLILP